MGFWESGNLAYRDKIVGIHAPEAQSDELRKLYEYLLSHRGLLRFCCALNGTQALVGKATAILKQDIDLLPYPSDISEISQSAWEEALQFDVLNHMLDFVRLGQNSKLLKATATSVDLDTYSALFVRMLGSVYTNLSAGRPIFWDTLICQPFFFGETPEIALPAADDERALREIIFAEDRHASLRTVRLLRFYDKNTLLLAKPNRLRYWIPSTAIRDADETLPDLVNWGY